MSTQNMSPDAAPAPVSDDAVENAARVWVHEDIDSLYDAEHDDHLLVRDAAHRLWLAWETEDGDWFAVRARDEDDSELNVDVGDRWRPIGPCPISLLHYPVTVVHANDALTVSSPRTITASDLIVGHSTIWRKHHKPEGITLAESKADWLYLLELDPLMADASNWSEFTGAPPEAVAVFKEWLTEAVSR